MAARSSYPHRVDENEGTFECWSMEKPNSIFSVVPVARERRKTASLPGQGQKLGQLGAPYRFPSDLDQPTPFGLDELVIEVNLKWIDVCGNPC
jgi:hypothetical protein